MEIIIPIAAIIILCLVFTWLFKVVKVSIKTLLAIAVILLLLQIGFNINSQQIIQELIRFGDRLLKIILGN